MLTIFSLLIIYCCLHLQAFLSSSWSGGSSSGSSYQSLFSLYLFLFFLFLHCFVCIGSLLCHVLMCNSWYFHVHLFISFLQTTLISPHISSSMACYFKYFYCCSLLISVVPLGTNNVGRQRVTKKKPPTSLHKRRNSNNLNNQNILAKVRMLGTACSEQKEFRRKKLINSC